MGSNPIFMMIWIFLSQMSYGQGVMSCADMDLRKEGRSMSKVPINIQVAGTCYAYSAAQAIDAYRFSHGENEKLHTDPLYLAMLQHADPKVAGDPSRSKVIDPVTRDFILDGGCMQCILGRIVDQESFCLNDLTGSSLIANLGEYYSQKMTTLSLLIEASQAFGSADFNFMLAKIKDHTRSTTYASESTAQPILEPLDAPKDYDAEVQKIRKEIENISAILVSVLDASPSCSVLLPKSGALTQVLTQYGYSPSLTIFRAMLETYCKKSSIHPKWLFKKWDRSEAEYTKTVFDAFKNSKNPQPISINYCANWVAQGLVKKTGQNLPDCGGHASLIIGSRVKNGKCEYLIRDNYKCSASKPGCDQGDQWHDARVIVNSFEMIMSFDGN